MAKKRFSFKSSGKRTTAKEFTNPVVVVSTIGIKTPLSFGTGKKDEDIYKMHTNIADQIRDNFRNILMTNFGERLGRADLGANLKSLLYDMTSLDSIESEVSKRIIGAAQKTLQMIVIKDININFVGLEDNNSISIKENSIPSSVGTSTMSILVRYNIPRINAPDQLIKVNIGIGG
tara:strand:- start:287 stop:814 length:528 start_codon:yes stop_codon:yes gene_type:complete